nr:immunoglobulin light chain junction region [Macaca mulatta]MOW43604.1 immunoglobulin light chain junction region [Macaca mulatta]MOW43989.1 immunoglobulin light chain junction region [Macaca mulatta]MOW44001.1 immunoglobulin light chain junction region [Macaca mulatta]
CMQRTQLPLTF